MNELERLRTDIMGQYASIHAFCRQHENLKRSTVYAVLSGRYPGKSDEQIRRIRDALDGQLQRTEPLMLTSDQIVETILKIRCRHCRPTSRRRCQRCRGRAGYEADAMIALLQGQVNVCQER